MKISLFTFTRDRHRYTRDCFASLFKCRDHCKFDHYVLDNGSKESTRVYLAQKVSHFKGLILSPFNYGLHLSAKMIRTILEPCDLVIKFDNDCYIKDPWVINSIARVYKYMVDHDMKYVFSPRVEGIVRQPKRGEQFIIQDGQFTNTLSRVGQIGGICMCIPYKLFNSLTFNEALPMAKGLDSSICSQAVSFGYKLAYIEDIVVHHYETTNGQGKRYPEYFKRKRVEENKSFS